ncbi:uncharacterized protein LOC115624594 isoform X2 [Scaptodrosophila lebanonensis]|uniref:Uncharacterized protein LOC115624594 isoform X2 n=1 Tax=Drosophila lebanonensis TaxID=7225 RepID=A0A6J2TGR4_DROLE|nr:uncharacterized protein LOC115624594 isoform X2 [Scaptodrosophila lebanonensis]
MNEKEKSSSTLGRDFSRNSKSYASLPNRGITAGNSTKTTIPALTVPAKSKEGQSEPERYGLSHSLSSDSVKQACDYYDDELSDDELIEVQQTPQSFHNQQQKLHACMLNPISLKMPLDVENSAFCKSEKPALSTPVKQPVSYDGTPDEALSVLDELDAILDVHGASQLNETGVSSISGSDDDKVEDYLLDLDNYLEEMDNALSNEQVLAIDSDRALNRDSRTCTLPLSRKRRQQKTQTAENLVAASPVFNRGHQMRKTFSCGLEPHTNAYSSTNALEHEIAPVDEWRRQSMRRAMNDSSIEHVETKATTTPTTTETPLSLTPTLVVNLPRDAEMRRCFSQGDCQPASRAMQMLTEAHIYNNLLLNEQRTARAASEERERPRQFGRRVEGHPRVTALANPSHGLVISRPQSAPAQTRMQLDELASTLPETTHIMSTCSDISSVRSSRMPSPVSMASASSSSDSSTIGASTTDQVELQQTTTCSTSPLEPMDSLRLHQQQQQREKCGFNSLWPHSGSRMLALMGCTLGVFNICRFAVLTINYGGNFLLQFLMLSIIFGIPLLWLQMCLGAKIKAGPVSMWKISPICSGVGIALVMVQCFLAIYSTVSVAWILVYLRDVFPTPTRNAYRWQELAFPYRYDAENATGNLTHTVAEYFNIVVLQRLQFARHGDGSGVRFHVNDRLAFYLALIWAAVFLILCKGLKSLGKWTYLINTLPLLALIVVTAKFVYVVDPSKLQNIFSATDFDDFLINSKTWTAATQETFLTWGLLGASVIAITSRSHMAANKSSLRRDAILLVLVTMLALSLTALLALCCAQILRQHNYVYVPGSFETPDSSTSIYSLKAHPNPEIISHPPALVPHYSSFIGETYRRPTAVLHRESGFQALRFITELFPAVLSLSSDAISWVWAAVAFGLFALFGLAQLCVMWKPISSALGNSTSSVLLSCVTGLLLSIPFATEMGISILYYVDYLLGGSWFIPIIWTAQIFGVFLIRGRPYNGDDLVNDLRMCGSMSAFLALSWNVLLPIGLVTLSVIDYKASLSNQFYYWRGKSYFSYLMRKMGSLIQIGLLLVIPVTAIVQIYRYLTRGPPDILERIQLLYRPPEDSGETRRSSARQRDSRIHRNGAALEQNSGERDAQHDAPPKYTPPPSYTTATGARLAKMLRQSIRRSVRRVLGDSTSRTRPILSIDAESPTPAATNAPPDYLTILTNPSGSSRTQSSSSPESIEIGQRPSVYTQRTLSLGRKVPTVSPASTQRPASANAALEPGGLQRPYTAEDVVTILRSSVRGRQPRHVGVATTLPRQPPMSTHLEDASFRSIENLVLNAEPPDQTPGVELECRQNNNTSVI